MQFIHLNPGRAFKMNKNLDKRKLAPGEFDNDVVGLGNEEIHLKFCKAHDINKSQQQKMVYKATFLNKIQ